MLAQIALGIAFCSVAFGADPVQMAAPPKAASCFWDSLRGKKAREPEVPRESFSFPPRPRQASVQADWQWRVRALRAARDMYDFNTGVIFRAQPKEVAERYVATGNADLLLPTENLAFEKLVQALEPAEKGEGGGWLSSYLLPSLKVEMAPHTRLNKLGELFSTMSTLGTFAANYETERSAERALKGFTDSQKAALSPDPEKGGDAGIGRLAKDPAVPADCKAFILRQYQFYQTHRLPLPRAFSELLQLVAALYSPR